LPVVVVVYVQINLAWPTDNNRQQDDSAGGKGSSPDVGIGGG